MLTIVKISKKKENYLVYFSDDTSLLVTEDQLVSHRLLKGKEILEDEILKIKKEGSEAAGLNLALHYLNYGLKSAGEIFAYLKKHDVSKEDRQLVVEKLKELGYVDDLHYAKSFVNDQINFTKTGPMVIMLKLKEKKISDELIQEALAGYSQELELKNAQKIAEQYLNKTQKIPYGQKLQKLRNHLHQKGFLPEAISQIMANVPENPQEKEDKELLLEMGEKAFVTYGKDPFKKKQKVKAFLYRKGFPLEDIQEFIDNYQGEERE